MGREKVNCYTSNQTGSAFFGPFNELTSEKMYEGINSRLMGQVNLVLEGRKQINPKGSFTLTSGILSEDPRKMGTALSLVNGACLGCCNRTSGKDLLGLIF